MSDMKCNMSKTDRIIRAVVGAVIIAAGAYYQAWWALIIGAVLVITSIAGLCLIYLIFGISSCKTPDTSGAPEN